DVGEFGLIDRLARLVSRDDRDPLRPAPEGPLGIGDDAALWMPALDRPEVLTTDALVEGVHFKLSTTGWRDLGWKALAENVSDVAAMGARPRRAFVTIGVPRETRVSDLEELYRGLRDLADRFDVAIAGGDTVSSPLVFLSVTVVGEVPNGALRRGAGRPGDLLAVTGALGASAGGLELLEAGLMAAGTPDEQALITAHRRPGPRVDEAMQIAAAGVACGLDLSDGLLGDSGKLAYASGIAAVLEWEAIPVVPALERRFGDRARKMALAGGEDYELLVAGRPEAINRAGQGLAAAGLIGLSVVGRLIDGLAGRVTVVDRFGEEIATEPGSWDHFAVAGSG
ncbi:MAG: thiamine-phosphate kinase, partial [Chloroflexi bacterium]|nr:thiamine-phosphate kinase [Chloroflexota bacterium]